jgi:peroxiredoxin
MNSIKFYKITVLLFFLASSLAGCSEEGRVLLEVGKKAPPFTLKLVNGGEVTLDQFAGKGLVITFMASWCPCSNDSIPLMIKAYQQHKDNISFLMVGIQDAESKFEKFVNKWNVPFPSGYDDGATIAKAYGIGSPPTTYFIDKSGIVKRAFYGNIKDKKNEFAQWLEEIT